MSPTEARRRSLIALLRAQIESLPCGPPVAELRRARMSRALAFLESGGFPTTLDDKARLSVIPFIFQEANHDGYWWSQQDADLGHLAPLFDIDVRLLNEGHTREELTAEEFDAYILDARSIVDAHTGAAPLGRRQTP